MGSICQRKHKDKKTDEIKEIPIRWIKYYRHGKSYRESTGAIGSTLQDSIEENTGKRGRPIEYSAPNHLQI